MEKEILNKVNNQILDCMLTSMDKNYDKSFAELQENYKNFQKEVSDLLRHEKNPEDVLNSNEFNYVLKNHAKLILSFCKGVIEGEKTASKTLEKHGDYEISEIDDVVNTDVIDSVNDCLENEMEILFENVAFDKRHRE